MPTIQRLPFAGTLPSSFFDFSASPYNGLGYCNPEEPVTIQELFRIESERSEIIIYQHEALRLVGIFPYHSEEAFFGFWETLDTADVNQVAFAMLGQDATERGKTKLTGPIDFNTFHRYRLRLGEVPSWVQFDREPVNPPYYAAILTALGFKEISTFESRLIQKETIPAVYLDKKLFLEELAKIPYEFIPVNPEVWQAYEHEIYVLVDEIFSQNPAYKSVSEEQFKLLYNEQYAAKLCPHSSVLFRHKESGRLAALSFCHPNYHSLQLPAGITPVFRRDYPRLEKLVLLAKTVGVHPDFRKQGLMNFLGAYGMVSFQDLYEEVLFCLMRSDNFSTHFTDMLPYESARYALFSKSLRLYSWNCSSVLK